MDPTLIAVIVGLAIAAGIVLIETISRYQERAIRLRDALQDIANQRGPKSNATVQRMANMAETALLEDGK